MKTLTQLQYRRHDMMTWSLAIVLFIIIMLACMTSCSYKPAMSYDVRPAYMNDTAKWNEFIRLTNLPGEGGDASCDSIFTMIYGYSLEFK